VNSGAAHPPAEAGPAPRRPATRSCWLTRFVFLRLLGLVYAVAFLVLLRQGLPLLGSHGLLPAAHVLEAVAESDGHGFGAFLRLPTLFWLAASDGVLSAATWIGLALALVVVLGRANAPLLAALWLLYMSFAHVGQIFYGYGWEILLLEAGFLAIFLAPPWRSEAFPPASPPPAVVIVLLRWLLFRVMFGAGLIKLRGDPCWRELSCLVYHYETQPIPNPLSWYLHQAPLWFHKLEALYNHLAELVAPLFVFGPRRLRHVAGLVLVVFQLLLIASGNLSFLNWLTLAVCLSCFDDGALAHVLPARLTARVAALPEVPLGTARRAVVWSLAALVAFLSLNPVANMLSVGQVMNTSYDPFDLVNTYGAFGTVGRERNEVILQGTADAVPEASAHWVDYEFPCKPGDVMRRPCVVSPYQPRLDWQMWFAAMEDPRQQPWLIQLVAKLLETDPGALSLLANDHFRDHPPRYIRAELYRFEFTRLGEGSKAWWRRSRIAAYLPPLSAADLE